MRVKFLIIFTLFMTLQYVYSISADDQCALQDNCERCLSANIQCAWCADKRYEPRIRCLTRSRLEAYGCRGDSIYENEPGTRPMMAKPLKDYEAANDRAVQVTPQKVHLKLVKSHTQRIKLSYRPARNNPLDLYVLMDLTWTMRDDKDTLVKLGSELIKTLRNLTPSYRLGFGSFADKPIMPMAMPQLKNNPCASEHAICEPTYSYRHQVSLSADVDAFVNSLNNSRVTGNLDNLEGGLDALMQVLVCPQQIGWKEEARKVVILVTDGFMHFAGDGLLAGIIQRNDKQCYLNVAGEYVASLIYDYPSLEEIYHELLKRKINVIFAVTKPVVSTYQAMSKLMKQISSVEILSADSSNILELIEKSYDRFIKRTQFSDNSPDFIDMKYETDCGGQFNKFEKRNYCSNIELGKQVDFYVDITLKDYPSDGVYTHKIRVDESSLSEYLELEVELQRPCPCTEESESESDSSELSDMYGRLQCSDHGYMQCGMCYCDLDWTGINCNCPTNATNATTNDMLKNMCKQPTNEPNALAQVCSNHGECDCGICFCEPGYGGKYCECPDCSSECDPEHADCICGHCVCRAGWSGILCNCKETTDGCMGPDGELCSGRGECICGKCECVNQYLGKFCEIGWELDNKLCTFYEPCVQCLIEQKLALRACENLSELCSSPNREEKFAFAFVDDTIDAEVRCVARITNKDGIKCDSFFKYESLGPTENYLVIQVNECLPINFATLGVGLALFTLLIGLLIIFTFRLCIRVKDAREWARFEEDQRNSIRTENPIYKNPLRHYSVPRQISWEPDENPFALD